MNKQKQHTRVINSLTGNAEKKFLAWLASKMPLWVTSDLMTIIGILGSVIIFASYCLTNLSPNYLWLASFGFILNWFGDSLDGTLARYRKAERPNYGFFIDHAVDAISEVLIFLGLGISPYVKFDLATLALIGYMLLSIYVYLLTYVVRLFRITFIKLGPTEIRIIAILCNTILFFVGKPSFDLPFGTFTFYDIVVALLAVALYVAFIVNTITTSSRLSRHDMNLLKHK